MCDWDEGSSSRFVALSESDLLDRRGWERVALSVTPSFRWALGATCEPGGTELREGRTSLVDILVALFCARGSAGGAQARRRRSHKHTTAAEAARTSTTQDMMPARAAVGRREPRERTEFVALGTNGFGSPLDDGGG